MPERADVPAYRAARKQEPLPDPQGGNDVGAFLNGAIDIWRGFGLLLRRPSLWPWAIIPFVLNILFFVGLAWGVWHWGSAWVEQHWLAGDQWWVGALAWVLSVLFVVIMGLLIVFLFVPIAALIAAPFNDFLSEKVERLYCNAGVDESFSLRVLMIDLARGMRTSIKLAVTTLGLILLTFPLYLIPGIGSMLAAAASALITIRFLSLEFTSYSMDRRHYTYEQRRRWLRAHRARSLGLGTMAFLIMLVPVLNAMFIPISAIAGTILFCDTELRNGSDLAGG